MKDDYADDSGSEEGKSYEKKETLTEKMRENPWILSTLILGLILIIFIFYNSVGKITGNVISADAAGERLLDFYTASGAEGLTLNSVDEINGLYKVNFEYQGAIIPIYMTKDGELAGNMNSVKTKVNADTLPQEEVPKSDKPKIELFVMSYCPYGTQAEKGILPVVALLKDKIDFKLRFVHYILHGDKEDLENKRQLCIREEQGQNKLNVYLTCILDSDNPNVPGEVSACEKKAGIDSAKLQTCLKNKSGDYYNTDSKLSESYSVRGSPTLIINGAGSSAGRSSQSYLEGICNAFNNAPEECQETLSDKSPSAGFGYNEGTDSVAQCG